MNQKCPLIFRTNFQNHIWDAVDFMLKYVSCRHKLVFSSGLMCVYRAGKTNLK